MAISAKSKILASDINTALSGKQDALGYTPVKSVNGVSADAEGNVALNAVITETWYSGRSWYHKWSDGFIMQAGTASSSSSGNTVSFHKAFTSAPFVMAYRPMGSSYPDVKIEFGNIPDNITASNFRISVGGNGQTIIWYACGY